MSGHLTKKPSVDRVLYAHLTWAVPAFGIPVDKEGWVSAESVLASIRVVLGNLTTMEDIEGVVKANPNRYELKDGKIRLVPQA